MTGESAPLPDRPPLDPARLRASLLRPDSLWRSIDVVEATGSTNADLRRLARTGARGGTVLIAEEQLTGRGRLGRTWQAPARSSLAVSVLLRPPAGTPTPWGWLSLLAGLAVADAVASTTGQQARVKWPNDVLLSGAKVAGVLAERVPTPAGHAAVIGIGVNVSQTAAELPVSTAASLWSGGAGPVDRTGLAIALLTALAERYGEWLGARPALFSSYRARSDTVGRRVRALLPGDRTVTGTAVDVDDEGRLLVDTDGGRVVVAAGDVVHLR